MYVLSESTPIHVRLSWLVSSCIQLIQQLIKFALKVFNANFDTTRRAAIRCDAVRCDAFRCGALRRAPLQCGTLSCATMRHAALRPAAQRCGAARCVGVTAVWSDTMLCCRSLCGALRAMQWSAAACGPLRSDAARRDDATRCEVIQCGALRCDAMRGRAMRCVHAPCTPWGAARCCEMRCVALRCAAVWSHSLQCVRCGDPSMTMCFNSSPQRFENDLINTKLCSYNLVSVVIRICTV